MTLTVTAEDVPGFVSDGGVVVMQGRDDTGRVFRFGADWRMADGLIDFVQAEGEITVEVEDWQVLSHG